MSADLFALFGDLSETATPQQNQKQQTQGSSHAATTTAAPAAGDPFSFLASTSSTSQSQSNQQSTQWPPLQQPTTGQLQSFTPPISAPQTSNGWGDIGGLGSLGSFQNQPTAFLVSQEPVQMEGDDDGWGDFEVAPANPPPQPPAPTTMSSPPRARITRASTFDLMANKLVDLGLESSAADPWEHRPSSEKEAKAQQPQKPARNPDPNVLFDADFEAGDGTNDDDDFGDFETGTPATAIPQAAPPKSALDLLSLDSEPEPAPAKKQPPGLTLSNAALKANAASYPDAPKSPYGSFQDRKPEPVKQLQVQPPAVKALQGAEQPSPSPVTAWPAVENDGFGNHWEEFKDLPDTKPAAAKPKPTSKTKPTPKPTAPAAPDWDWQDWGAPDDHSAPAPPTTTTKTKTSTTTTTTAHPPPPAPEANPGPPPTNIPPPAILLSLFPSLLDLASTALLKPLFTLPPSSPAHQRVLASDATLTFLRGYLALATVAARLIAGRKHRWHRDKFLAQGMSIAALGGSGVGGQRGMKLASVDKAQAAHEDREAAEVAGVWKRQVGRLRAVVAGVNAANQQQHGTLRVPEVAVGLAVSTAKGVPTAPRACVVCGLKRDERVAKVDGEVEDSFGEWWVEFWGHRECRNFWVGHEKELRQR
ncbi:hypothetical protein C8A01DRAFT_31911 [Parachaetomium inaequale]|uniref:Uncharacterized protein n=1 Tax=Parachaetomium inaequale TaxID=2588326 RepID=A0AAN6PPW5_9PEZI|nr:hypothetical protein C8A01DRAFT_31911 [Parachaetomium inaequale]